MNSVGIAYVFVVQTVGYLDNFNVDRRGGLVPVINLSYEYTSTLIGDGTMENPYRME